DVIGEAQRPSQKPAAEIQQQVEGLANLRTPAEEIAERDQAAARREEALDGGLQPREARRLAMDGGHRPDPPGAVEHGELVPILAHAETRSSAARRIIALFGRRVVMLAAARSLETACAARTRRVERRSGA